MGKKQTAIILDKYELFRCGKLVNIITQKEVKFYLSNNGYMRTTLYSKNKQTTITQHRILAQNFIPNPENKTQVNHKNGVKHDNRLENLEWATPQENTIHSFSAGLQKPTRPCKKVINTITKEIYESVTEASNCFKISRSHLSNILLNKKTNKLNLKFYE